MVSKYLYNIAKYDVYFSNGLYEYLHFHTELFECAECHEKFPNRDILSEHSTIVHPQKIL